jgi:NADH-quinone oxidoreductase subunit N
MDLSQAYANVWVDMGGAFSLVILSFVGLGVIVYDAFRNNAPSIPWIAAIAVGAAMLWEMNGMFAGGTTAFHAMIRVGGIASFINFVILIAALFSIILSVPYLTRLQRNYGEVYALILFATAGAIVLGTSNNLVSMFVGLETMSVCLYIMAGLLRDDDGGAESALKYFLLGAFSTGFFLYGIALLYGATGTMYLPELIVGAAGGSGLMYWAGVGLLLVGFLFKVSAVPFHMWTPDAYQGAPTTLTGFMSTASKTAAFAALILVLFHAVPAERWQTVFAVIAVLTMVVGNVIAISQVNVKRMLAYSSVAHAGYIMVGLAAGTPAGYGGALFYLLVYTLMNIGAFGVLALAEWDGKAGRLQTIDSLAGLGWQRPLLGITMGFFMFSLLGFPPLGGFFGKYAVFAPAVEAGLTWLVIVGVLMSAVSGYYYLRVLFVLWMKSPEDELESIEARKIAIPVPAGSAAVLVICAVLLVVFGLFPGLIGVATDLFQTDVPTIPTTLLGF